MKKEKLSFLIILIFSICLYSCEKNPSDIKTNNQNNGSNNNSTAGNLSVPSTISIGSSAGTVYIPVTSNTEWTISINNTGSSLNGLDVSPFSGVKNGTVQVKYGGVSSTYYNSQSATVIFYFYSYGTKQSVTCNIFRRGNFP